MNFATSLQLNSTLLPAWAETTIRNTRQAAAYSHRVIKAFNKTLAPLIATTAKDLSRYYWLCFQGAEDWTMDRTPISSAIRTVKHKLTSAEAQTTYRRIRHITREAAMTALDVGLRGVVALSVGIELAQAGYRAAEKLYRAVYGRLNPNEPKPELLPSVNIALASTELAAALDNFATVAEADVKAKAEAEAIAEVVPDFWAEPLTLAPAPEPVTQPEPQLQPEQKPVRRGRSRAETQPKAATKTKRKPVAKAKAGGK
jgi:hypothetical protein